LAVHVAYINRIVSCGAILAAPFEGLLMLSVMDPLNLVLLVIAAIVAWRLWSVLGSRTGLEKPPIVLQPTPERPQAEPRGTALEGEVLEPETRKPVWFGQAEDGSDVAKGLDDIANRTAGFMASSFIRGANAAYEMVLEAYAKADKPALKPLLSKELFDSFASAIDARKSQNQSATFQFVGVKSASIKRAAMIGNKAQVDVDFVAEMISATLDQEGAVVDGDAKSIRTVTDLWTFERDVTSKDPNWKLVATDDNV
jgi:predicted lipid-binding transport protein (Tim44 family)